MKLNDINFLCQSLEKEISNLRKELSKCPQGTLVICNINGKNRYYHQKKNADGSYSRHYLGKDNIGLARHLARKTYIKNKLLDLENELKSIRRYLSVRKKTDYKQLLTKDSIYRELFAYDSWEYEPYDKSTSHPEALIIQAPKGDIVRSKSEALIANALYDRGIPYRYECGLDLGGYIFHPDFTVKKVGSGEIIIWEHFGKVDDPKYFQKNVVWKLKKYIENGYIPGKNLIITWETKNTPLSIEEVSKMIEHYIEE